MNGLLFLHLIIILSRANPTQSNTDPVQPFNHSTSLTAAATPLLTSLNSLNFLCRVVIGYLSPLLASIPSAVLCHFSSSCLSSVLKQNRTLNSTFSATNHNTKTSRQQEKEKRKTYTTLLKTNQIRLNPRTAPSINPRAILKRLRNYFSSWPILVIQADEQFIAFTCFFVGCRDGAGTVGSLVEGLVFDFLLGDPLSSSC